MPTELARALDTQSEPVHIIRAVKALLNHWSQAIEPEPGESRAVGYQATHWLSSILSHADDRFLWAQLERGEPLRLSASEQERMTGYSERHCRRLRAACERHGLIRVVAGSATGGGSAPALYIDLQAIIAPTVRVRRMYPRRERESGLTVRGVRTDSPHMDPPVPGPAVHLVRSGERAMDAPDSEHPEPDQTPEVAPDDLDIARPVIDVWRESPRCSPRRRMEPVRSARDADVVRRMASLIRGGVSVETVSRAVREVVDGYSPDADPKRSPFIVSLVWFSPALERVEQSEARRKRATPPVSAAPPVLETALDADGIPILPDEARAMFDRFRRVRPASGATTDRQDKGV